MAFLRKQPGRGKRQVGVAKINSRSGQHRPSSGDEYKLHSGEYRFGGEHRIQERFNYYGPYTRGMVATRIEKPMLVTSIGVDERDKITYKKDDEYIENIKYNIIQMFNTLESSLNNVRLFIGENSLNYVVSLKEISDIDTKAEIVSFIYEIRDSYRNEINIQVEFTRLEYINEYPGDNLFK